MTGRGWRYGRLSSAGPLHGAPIATTRIATSHGDSDPDIYEMCKFCCMTQAREAVLRLFRVGHNRAAAFEPKAAILPGHAAPVIRMTADGERELALPQTGGHRAGQSGLA